MDRRWRSESGRWREQTFSRGPGTLIRRKTRPVYRPPLHSPLPPFPSAWNEPVLRAGRFCGDETRGRPRPRGGDPGGLPPGSCTCARERCKGTTRENEGRRRGDAAGGRERASERAQSHEASSGRAKSLQRNSIRPKRGLVPAIKTSHKSDVGGEGGACAPTVVHRELSLFFAELREREGGGGKRENGGISETRPIGSIARNNAPCRRVRRRYALMRGNETRRRV